MTPTKPIDIRRTLSSIASKEFLETTAREEGFIVRSRKIDPVAFFWTLVLGFGIGAEKSFAGLRRCYQVETGTTLVPSAFYDRFTQALIRWLRRVTTHVLSSSAEPSRALRGRLAGFADVLAVDGTVLRLHELLQKAYPACRTNHTKAAAKLTVLMSVVGRGPRTIQLSPERTNDSKLLRVHKWVEGRLLLFDLGYYCYRLFATIDRHGGYFVTRMKSNANPILVRQLHGTKTSAKQIEGKPLQDVLRTLRRPVLDAEAKVRYKTRQGRWTTAVHRLVALRNAETREYHVYLTNIPCDRLTAEDIACTYAVRWEIEIIFRQLKSQFRVDQLPSSKAHIVEALIYASILTLAVSRTFLMQLRHRYHEMAGRIPHERWAIVFASFAPVLLTQILASRRRAKRRRSDLFAVMVHEMVDPNLSRLGGLLGPLETVRA